MKTGRGNRVLRVALALLITTVALALAGFAALWIWMASTEGHPPRMFSDLPVDFRNERPATARMAETFPPGTPEGVLVARLQEEGFEVDKTSRRAVYAWGNGFPCSYSVDATWTAKDGRITSSRALYGNACM